MHAFNCLTLTRPSRYRSAWRQLTLFNEEDISTMFSMFDPTGKGFISQEQYKQGE